MKKGKNFCLFKEAMKRLIYKVVEISVYLLCENIEVNFS